MLRFSYHKIAILVIALSLLASCSTKKNTFLSRNFHALVTKYNVLFNGKEALNKGVEELRVSYKDNFWETLPLERLDISDEMMMPGDKKNPNFERAENKAVKAIQKHSINIDGFEYNYQIDEAFFTLGKARYYDQRFNPALEAFNYVLYKYPDCNIIDEVKVWREKTNMRLGNNALAIQNIRELQKKENLKRDIDKEAEMLLAQTFINLKEIDSALGHTNKALKKVKIKEEKARLLFIKGQLHEQLEQKDSALVTYQKVIDMKRKSPRSYIIHAHTNSLQYFDYENGDRVALEEKFKKLVEDFENREYVGVIYYQMGNYFTKIDSLERAEQYYNLSLKSNSSDNYLKAMNYSNLGKMSFDNGAYVDAGKYYDSTLTNLEPKTRLYRSVDKKLKNLQDVIKYETIRTEKDSIIRLVKMDSLSREKYFSNYITTLKAAEEERIQLEAKQNQEVSNATAPVTGVNPSSAANVFYFYNVQLVQKGKIAFEEKWGKRKRGDNWRYSKDEEVVSENNSEQNEQEVSVTDKKPVDDKYNTRFYISKLPSDTVVIDSIIRERNFAYYQLGLIYKDKYRRYDLAEAKFNTLLSFNPDEKYTLPVLYNLYKMYRVQESDQAEVVKNRIISEYPDSRHAQLLNNTSITEATDTPENKYNSIKEKYDKGEYNTVLDEIENALIQYQGEPVIPKLELLKAYTLGKVKGVEAYKEALVFVSLNYPNYEAGKTAEKLLRTGVLKVEQLKFEEHKKGYYKIVYTYDSKDQETISKDKKFLEGFIKEIQLGPIHMTEDYYNESEKMLVLHRFTSENKAKHFLEELTKLKKIKFRKDGVILSNHNYKVVQINKNLKEYIKQQQEKTL